MEDLEMWRKGLIGGVEVAVSSFGNIVKPCGKKAKPYLNHNFLYIAYAKNKQKHVVSLANLIGETFFGEVSEIDMYRFSEDVNINNIGSKSILDNLEVVGKKRRGLNLIAGFGLNDVKIPTKVEGLKSIPYQTWISMIHRCYGVNREKCYEGVSVCKEWSRFSSFLDDYQYMVGSYQKGFVLDKDILCLGEKMYSKESCVLIPKKLNAIFANWTRKLTVKEYEGGFTTSGQINNRKENRKVFSTKEEVEEHILMHRKKKLEEARKDFYGIVDFRVIEALEKILEDGSSPLHQR